MRQPIELSSRWYAGHAEAVEQRVVELEQLRVDRRVVGADRLDRCLPVLAVAALARLAVAVHRRDREHLHGLRIALHPVLDVRAADRRGALRAQRQRPVGAVGEVVHLLLHDVRALPGRAREERRVLEDGREHLAVAVERAEPLDLARDALPERHLGGDDVVRPARTLDLAAHCCCPGRAEVGEKRVAGRAPRRGSSRGRGRDGRSCRADTRRGARRSTPAARPSPRPEGRCGRPSRRRARRPRRGGRPRRRRGGRASGPGTSVTAKEMPATSTVSPPSSQTSGGRAADGDPRRRERGRLLDQDPLARRGVDGCAGLLGQVGEADDVVEVAVGDEDRGATRRLEQRAPPGSSPASPLGSTTTASVALRRRADEIGVRPDRPELELVDLEAHRGDYEPRAMRFCCWRHTTRSMK